jgi:hypothetical protein
MALLRKNIYMATSTISDGRKNKVFIAMCGKPDPTCSIMRPKHTVIVQIHFPAYNACGVRGKNISGGLKFDKEMDFLTRGGSFFVNFNVYR